MPKSSSFSDAVRLHDDVGGFHVAVNHVIAMRVSQRIADLLDDLQLKGKWLRLAGLDEPVERIAGQIFHHDVGKAILLA